MIALSRSRAVRRAAPDLYAAIVAAARAPVFYREYAVADTIEGRYEMIVLHMVLLLRRLRAEDNKDSKLAQALVDFFAADLDRSMRELGVGDLGVGRFMKRLGEGLYGRAAAYDAALDNNDDIALGQALLRNIYSGIGPGDFILGRFVRYINDQCRHLAGQAMDRIREGRLDLLLAEGEF